MEIRIFQINTDRDEDAVAFESLDRLEKYQHSSEVKAELYDKVYEGEVGANDLEDVYRIFNISKPEGYKGRSLSVSDVVEVVTAKKVKPGFYFCDSVGFKEVPFLKQESLEIKPLDKKGDLSLFSANYGDYCTELDKYLPSQENDLEMLILTLLGDPDVYIQMIYWDKNLAGVFLYGIGHNCHEECDYYIQDFYIIPQFRKQHIGQSVVERFTKEHPGRYCLRVIESNEPAQRFWKTVWNKIGAKDISDELTDYTPAGFDFYAYETKGEGA